MLDAKMNVLETKAHFIKRHIFLFFSRICKSWRFASEIVIAMNVS